MKTKAFIFLVLVSQIIVSQTIIDFSDQDFSGSGFLNLNNSLEISGYRFFNVAPDELLGSEGGIVGNGRNIVAFREGFTVSLTIESIDGENFKLESFYFGGVDDSNIISIEGFEGSNSTGVQNSGFIQIGTQNLNSSFDNVNKVVVTVEAIDSFSNVFGAFDDFVIKPALISTLSNQDFDATNTSFDKDDVFFNNGKFETVNATDTFEIYTISGQKVLNENLNIGVYIVKVINILGNSNTMINIAN